jgi:histidinol-phosphate phosphatase family protein
MRLSREVPNVAAFLDRDGTINRHVGHISHPDALELLPGAGRAIRALNEAGVLALVITNQPVVAHGLCDEAMLQRIHQRLEELLDDEGARLDAIYCCLHHPEPIAGGGHAPYGIACACRKPKTGLIERAAREWGLDWGGSAMFGDSWRDAEAARNAGVPMFLVGPAASWDSADVRVADDLQSAVLTWLSGKSYRLNQHEPRTSSQGNDDGSSDSTPTRRP